MNIGIDFGSTYSLLSRYRSDHNVLETLEDNNTTTIPSMVSLRKGNVNYGTYAKNLTGKKEVTTYKAFKMLLQEENKALLSKRGYDSVHTPEWATKEFLGNLIAVAQRTFGDTKIDHLVVGAPDNWMHSFDAVNRKKTLENICCTLEGVQKQNVTIVSEPVLASAYFAYNFQKQTNKPFNGVILIVDYGGGTLDLSLSEIKHGFGQSIEVKNISSRGAGENTDHSVGNAGIVYMESLMEYVIRKNTPDEADELIGTANFYKAVDDLERELKNGHSTGKIKYNYGGETGSLEYPEDFEDIYLESPITCGAEDYDVSYEDMLVVYNDVIRDVFEQTMDAIIADAKAAGIDVSKPNGDDFKIALVGGFGNFWLVHKQMQEKFEFTSTDDREKHIIVNEQDRERAISYGAALVASDTFSIRRTAPFSIGVYSEYDGQVKADYMIYHFDEIEMNRPYYAKEKNGEMKIFALGEDWADEFVIDDKRENENNNDVTDRRMNHYRIKDEYKQKLQNVIKNPHKTCGIGISFTDSDTLRLHIKEYFLTEEIFDENETVIDLGQMKETFEQITH